jgi:hypothetical protein
MSTCSYALSGPRSSKEVREEEREESAPEDERDVGRMGEREGEKHFSTTTLL